MSKMNIPIIERIDQDYNLTQSLDPEVKTLWFQISITNKYITAWPYANEFMMTKGRMKYLTPLYKAWNEVNRETAIQIFIAAYRLYHPMTRDKIRRVLNYYDIIE